MKFIKINNRILNLDAIADVQFDPGPPARLTVRYRDEAPGGRLAEAFDGDQATRLWAMLQPFCEPTSKLETK
jgi:hypothetical protein